MKRANCSIIEMYGTIGKRIGNNGKPQTLEVNLMKWKDGKPVYDIRWWTENEPMHGISLSEKSLAELGEIIDLVFREEK